MNVRYLFGLGIAALTLSASALHAQGLQYTFHDTASTIAPNWAVEFMTDIYNPSKQALPFNVVRVNDSLPSNDWKSWICTDICYDSSVSAPPTVMINPGATLTCALSIQSGTSKGDAHVTLRFSQGANLTSIRTQTYTAVFAESAVNEPKEAPSALRLPYPNPTTSLLMIPIGNGSGSSRSASLKVYDANGHMVGDFSDRARAAAGGGDQVVMLDFTSYPAGTYLYQLSVDGRTETSSFALVH